MIDQVVTRDDGFLMVTELLVESILAGFHVAEYPAILRVRCYGQSKARVLRITRAHLSYMASVIGRRMQSRHRTALTQGIR